MRNEIEILSYLDHPMVVKLYETFEHKKQLYLVIEYKFFIKFKFTEGW